MKNFKRVLGMALAAVLALSLATEPAYAAAKLNFPERITTYAYSKSNGNLYTSFSVSRRDDSTGKLANKVVAAKTSDKKVAYVSCIDNDTSTYNYEYRYFNEDGKEVKSNNHTSKGENGWTYFSFVFKKAGTVTFSFKLKGDKTYAYKTIVSCKDYTNPCKSITLSGANGGKSIASLTNNSSYVSKTTKISKNVNNAKLTIQAKDGWKISSLSICEYSQKKSADSDYYYRTQERSMNYYFNSGMVSKKAVNVGDLNKNMAYSIYVSFYNPETNGSISQTYTFNYK